jgi:hypothetical protein
MTVSTAPHKSLSMDYDDTLLNVVFIAGCENLQLKSSSTLCFTGVSTNPKFTVYCCIIPFYTVRLREPVTYRQCYGSVRISIVLSALDLQYSREIWILTPPISAAFLIEMDPDHTY